MRKLLVVLSLVALASACSPRHAGQVSWLVDGQPAADMCGELGDTVRIKVFPKAGVNAEMGDPVEEFTADCATGLADVSLGNYSTVFVELLRGENVVGLGGPVQVQAQGGLVGSLNPLTGALLVEVDIAVDVGFMDISFSIAQDTCEAMGVSSIDVQIYKQLVSLDREAVFEETQSVTCADGFLFDAADVGGNYTIEATTTAGGRTFGTAGPGHRVMQIQAAVATTINLIDITPPSE